MSLPFLLSDVRQMLLADSTLTALVPGGVATRKPNDVTRPYVHLQMPGNQPIDASANAYSPLVQVTVWSPLTWNGKDAETVVWSAAARAARLLATMRVRTFQGAAWNARVIDGPVPLEDRTRSDAVPLVGAAVRIEIRAHAAA